MATQAQALSQNEIRIKLSHRLRLSLAEMSALAALPLECFVAQILEGSIADFRLTKVADVIPLVPKEQIDSNLLTRETWRQKISPEKMQRILHALDQSVPVADIARRNGISGSSVRRIAAQRKQNRRAEYSFSRTARSVCPSDGQP